jgi:hypothetical protein
MSSSAAKGDASGVSQAANGEWRARIRKPAYNVSFGPFPTRHVALEHFNAAMLIYEQTPRETGVYNTDNGWYATYSRRGVKRILGPYRTAEESSKQRRLATDQEPITTRTSRFLGVGQHQGRWRARFNNKHIGEYGTETEAAKAHDTLSRNLHGAHAVVNFAVDGTETTAAQRSAERAAQRSTQRAAPNAAQDHLGYEDIQTMNSKMDFRMCTAAEHDAIVAKATAALSSQNTARAACVVTDEHMYTKDMTKLRVEELPFVAMKAVLVGQNWTTDAMLACYDCSMYHAELKGLLLSPRAFEVVDGGTYVWIGSNIYTDTFVCTYLNNIFELSHHV